MVAPLLVTLALAGHFSARVDNPYLPFRPGTTWRYRGAEQGKQSLDVVTVTRGRRRIAGAPCVTVRDRLYLSGRLAESTVDWYSQDRAGNVWYFGEATRELDGGGRVTSTEGSWRAGLRGARPGIVMPWRPRRGATFAQERFPGHAEDMFRVLGRDAVTVPYRTFRRALRTREWTRLEPGVIDHKFYVRGLGMVAERSARGPREHAELIAVTHSG